MEHIPAIHAAKVGMRYPARVTGIISIGLAWTGLRLELDLSALAPGRSPTLNADLRFTQTVAPTTARTLAPGDRVAVVLIGVHRDTLNLVASLPAEAAWLAWNNGTVRQLAQRIRETEETILLPVLADALEEAGCADAELLARCRCPGDEDLSWLVTLLAAQE